MEKACDNIKIAKGVMSPWWCQSTATPNQKYSKRN